MRASRVTVALSVALASSVARAAVLECSVTRKLDTENTYSREYLEKAKFTVLVEESASVAKLSRCSFVQSKRSVTCDSYDVDRVEYDANIGAKKFYVFRSQLDVQVFRDLTFVENNGRGGIAFGTCHVKSL